MKRIVCVLASMLVLVLTVGGDLSGYDRFGGPRDDGEQSYNPDSDDHPWGGDQMVVDSYEPTTRDDGRMLDSGNSIVDQIIVRIVIWLVPGIVTQETESRTFDVDTSQTVREDTVPPAYRRSTKKQDRVER